MDVKGPGCIWRTWAASAGDGYVKIYLDGAATPEVDLPFKDYFDGKTAPFNRPNIVYIASDVAHGFDNYTPIPFARSCKIVADNGWGAYYQFTYSQFPEGTVVPTFSMNLSATDSAALDDADKILGSCGRMPGDADGSEKISKSISVDGGSKATVVDLDGSKWHRDTLPPMRPDRLPDWALLNTTGTGRYVGTHLHVFNPGGDWWGKGDDKFFVDGEKFPSTFGTGSEDYFGYAAGRIPTSRAPSPIASGTGSLSKLMQPSLKPVTQSTFSAIKS